MFNGMPYRLMKPINFDPDKSYPLGNSGVETKNIIGSKESEFIEKEMKERVIYYKMGNYEKAYK